MFIKNSKYAIIMSLMRRSSCDHLQAIMLNRFDFKLVGKPEDVGMKTGATIHTMNGLNMIVEKSKGIPKTTGHWEMQHLKRGLSVTGMPHKNSDERQSK